MKIEKVNENCYRISDGNIFIEFNKERFEDIYFAVPKPPKLMNNTYLLRLLLDDISKSDDDRHKINTMLEKGDSKNSILEDLQKQIQKMPTP